jgi:hypothetical protein
MNRYRIAERKTGWGMAIVTITRPPLGIAPLSFLRDIERWASLDRQAWLG